jgi:hypothetical protein
LFKQSLDRAMQFLRHIMPIGGQYPVDLLSKSQGERFEAYFGLEGRHRYFSSGRSAFGYILEQIDAASGPVLMPDYGCWSALGPVLEDTGRDFSVYRVDEALSPQIDDADLRAAGALLLVNYFGMSDHGAFAAYAKGVNPDLVIILDQVPALYDIAAHHGGAFGWADWQFTSLRKWIGVPDGGVAIARDRDLDRAGDVADRDYPYEPLWRAAAQGKFDYFYRDAHLDAAFAAAFFEKFKQCEEAISHEYGPMSETTHALLDAFDLGGFAERRRANFEFLSQHWPDLALARPLYDALSAGRVPQYFVIDVDPAKRDDLREFMFAREIYPPVHWPYWNAYGSPLSERLLSLPLDQRYGAQNMERMIEAVVDFAAGGDE